MRNSGDNTKRILIDLVEDYKNTLEITDKVYVKIEGTFENESSGESISRTRVFEFSLNDKNNLEDEDEKKEDVESEEHGNMLISAGNWHDELLRIRDFFGWDYTNDVSQIRKVTFIQGYVPKTYYYKFDASMKMDNSIIGYVVKHVSSEPYNSGGYEIIFSSVDMIYAPYDCSYFFDHYMIECIEVDLIHLDTSKVRSMKRMFSKANGNLNLVRFDTSNVVDMSYMFYDCYNLTNLDLSSFDTSNVINMEGMFKDCDELKTIYVSDKFVTTKIENYRDMFFGCSKLIGGKGTTSPTGLSYKVLARIDNPPDEPGYFTLKED